MKKLFLLAVLCPSFHTKNKWEGKIFFKKVFQSFSQHCSLVFHACAYLPVSSFTALSAKLRFNYSYFRDSILISDGNTACQVVPLLLPSDGSRCSIISTKFFAEEKRAIARCQRNIPANGVYDRPVAGNGWRKIEMKRINGLMAELLSWYLQHE